MSGSSVGTEGSSELQGWSPGLQAYRQQALWQMTAAYLLPGRPGKCESVRAPTPKSTSCSSGTLRGGSLSGTAAAPEGTLGCCRAGLRRSPMSAAAPEGVRSQGWDCEYGSKEVSWRSFESCETAGRKETARFRVHAASCTAAAAAEAAVSSHCGTWQTWSMYSVDHLSVSKLKRWLSSSRVPMIVTTLRILFKLVSCAVAAWKIACDTQDQQLLLGGLCCSVGGCPVLG